MGESPATSKQITDSPRDPEECSAKEPDEKDDEFFSTPGNTAEPERLLAAATARFCNASVAPRITERVTTLGCTAPEQGRKLPVAQSVSSHALLYVAVKSLGHGVLLGQNTQWICMKQPTSVLSQFLICVAALHNNTRHDTTTQSI